MRRLTTCLLIVGSYATAAGQTGVSETSSSPNWNAGLFSSVEQCETDKSPQPSSPALTTLLTAKTVFVVGESPALDPTSKAVQTLKKALIKWGRFYLVDDAETADLIIVVSELSSSKPTKMERIREMLAIFVTRSMVCADATPLWAVNEVGPALGQRPTGKLVEDLRKQLTELENSTHASVAPIPNRPGSQEVFRSLTCAPHSDGQGCGASHADGGEHALGVSTITGVGRAAILPC